VPNGILYDYCNPPTLDEFITTTEEEDVPLMARLMITPNLVCSANNVIEDGSTVIAFDESKFKPRASGGSKGGSSGGSNKGNPNSKRYNYVDSSSFTYSTNTKYLSIAMFSLVWIFI